MWDALKTAAAEGCVLGVKWAIAVVIVAFTLGWIAQDYQIVRLQARNGEQAWRVMQQQARAAQANAAVPPKE